MNLVCTHELLACSVVNLMEVLVILHYVALERYLRSAI